MKAKKYRIVLINRRTGERKMMYEVYTSKKKAYEYASEFCRSIENEVADYEIKEI